MPPIVVVTHDSTGTVNVTDGTTTTYTTVVGPTPSPGTHASIIAAFDVPGGDTTVTASVSGGSSPTYLLVYAAEYERLSAFDVGSVSRGSAPGPDGMTTTVATTQANDLLVGFRFSVAVAPGSGFNLRSGFSQNVFEDRVVGAPGAFRATATMTSGPSWQMLAAAFKGR
jgi:hypothetical protein